MSTLELRREIKKAVDRLPAEQLASVADYVQFMTRPELKKRVIRAANANGRAKSSGRVVTDPGDAAESRRRLANPKRVDAADVFKRLGV